MSEVVCRCGRTADAWWRCGHPERPPLRCRLGIHDWSIVTWPIGVRWCFRCGKRGYDS